MVGTGRKKFAETVKRIIAPVLCIAASICCICLFASLAVADENGTEIIWFDDTPLPTISASHEVVTGIVIVTATPAETSPPTANTTATPTANATAAPTTEPTAKPTAEMTNKPTNKSTDESTNEKKRKQKIGQGRDDTDHYTGCGGDICRGGIDDIPYKKRKNGVTDHANHERN